MAMNGDDDDDETDNAYASYARAIEYFDEVRGSCNDDVKVKNK